MTVVFPFHQKDSHSLIRLLEWIKLLSKHPEHSALLVADADVDWNVSIRAVNLANEIFRFASLITNEKSVAGWIPGSNSLFKSAAIHMENTGEPWLWIEPDAVPTRATWLSEIVADYKKSGAPFMGAIVYHETPNLPNPYMEGCAVYPANAWTRMKGSFRMEQSWTLACAEAVLPFATNSSSFQHFWGPNLEFPPTFADVKTQHSPINTFTLETILPGCALFHRVKDGSLINLLRRKLFPDLYSGSPPCFVQLGRFGDIILLLPAFKEWADRFGKPPFVMCSREFGTVLEGVSYVTPVLTKLDWHQGLKEAVQTAKAHYGNAIQLQLHGAAVEPPKDSLPSYSMTMWCRTGLTIEDYERLPLVFDRRNQVREAQLVQHFIKPGKPTILLNFDAWTSPIAPVVHQLLQDAIRRLSNRFNFLYTSQVKATRVFDILGLMEKSAGMLTVDTMTLHLAAGCKIPYIALTRDDGQSGSIPKGNCVLQIGYSEIKEHISEIVDTMERWGQ